MSEFKDLTINFLLVGLVIFGILAFVVGVQEDNNVSDKFIDNSLINGTYGTLRTDLLSFQNQSQAQKLLFEREQPTLGFGTLLFYSIISSGKVFNSMIGSIFNTVIKLPVVVLGIDPVILSVIASILIITIIIGLWIVYKIGG